MEQFHCSSNSQASSHFSIVLMSFIDTLKAERLGSFFSLSAFTYHSKKISFLGRGVKRFRNSELKRAFEHFQLMVRRRRELSAWNN